MDENNGALLKAVANLLLAREGEPEPEPYSPVTDVIAKLNALAEAARAQHGQ